MCHSVERSDGRGCLERIIRYVGSCLRGMPYVNDRGRGSECFQGMAVSDHASRGIYSVWFSCLLLFGQNEGTSWHSPNSFSPCPSSAWYPFGLHHFVLGYSSYLKTSLLPFSTDLGLGHSQVLHRDSRRQTYLFQHDRHPDFKFLIESGFHPRKG